MSVVWRSEPLQELRLVRTLGDVGVLRWDPVRRGEHLGIPVWSAEANETINSSLGEFRNIFANCGQNDSANYYLHIFPITEKGFLNVIMKFAQTAQIFFEFVFENCRRMLLKF